MVKHDEELVACGMMLAHRWREALLERAEEIRTGYSHSPPDGRVVAVCFANNEDMNRWMVLIGWAMGHRRYVLDCVPIEKTAREARIGIWSGAFDMPWDWHAAATQMTRKYDYDKEVHNGDIGYIDDVDPDDGELTASFDGRTVTSGFGELDTLVPAYAATIHKSQGSEYPAVVIPVVTQHYAMLQRNLLYAGVTRGKKLVVLVGQKKAVAIAVRNVSGRRRWSKLSERLASKKICRSR